MKEFKISIYISGAVGLVSLGGAVLIQIFCAAFLKPWASFLINVLISTFGGCVLSAFLSTVSYWLKKKEALESFFIESMKAIKVCEKMSNGQERPPEEGYEQKYWMAFSKISYFLPCSKKQRAIREEIYRPIANQISGEVSMGDNIKGNAVELLLGLCKLPRRK